MRLAETLSPAIAEAFLETVKRMAELYSGPKLEEALHTGQLDLFLDELTTSSYVMAPLKSAVQDAVVAAGKDAAGKATAQYSQINVAFDGYNPTAVKLIAEQGARLVRQVSTEVRSTIRQVVIDGIRARTGIGPMSREIKDFIGLTTTQQRAVANVRRMLESGDEKQFLEYLTRKLRDRRFDATVHRLIDNRGPAVSQEKIDKMVERYRQRYLDHRATTIARTESITALNSGQTAAWKQAVEDGEIAYVDVRRFWHTARDERTCPYCLPVPDMNPKGVGLDEQFETPMGMVHGPTLHPNCRCTAFVRPFFR